MFEHLDDPHPFVPGPELRRSVERRGRSLRRHRRLAASGAVAAVLVIAGVASAGTFVDRKLDAVETVDVANLRETAAPGDPKVVLFVGVDSDAGLATAEREGPFRSDTMILARVDPGKEMLTVLPLPRDLLVDIPGEGKGRLNAAFAHDGPSLLIEAIDQNLGIEVDHYVETDFDGAIAIGDSLGGLRLSFPHAVRDGNSGLEAAAGCTSYRGRELLQVGRARHLRYLEDGRWQVDPTSDLGRMERQQAIAKALLKRLSELDATDPREAVRLVDAVSKHLVIDSETTTDELLGLFRGVSGSHYESLRLPVTDAVYGEADVLELGQGWEGVTSAFLDIAPSAPGSTATDPAVTTTTDPAVTTTTVHPTTPIVSTPIGAVPTPC